MKHLELDKHEIIAWDVDGTLVEGKNSKFWGDYIRAHPEKKHYIVTFRDTNWAASIPDELAHYGLKPSLFEGIANCPDELHNSYAFLHNSRWDSVVSDLKKSGALTEEAVALVRSQFLSYKARACIELGATVLIDDMEHWVEQGCIDHGVVFVHAVHDAA